LWNWNLRQLRPSNFGQRAGDKRTSAHGGFSFLCLVKLERQSRAV
jgi:hypothetical protein